MYIDTRPLWLQQTCDVHVHACTHVHIYICICTLYICMYCACTCTGCTLYMYINTIIWSRYMYLHGRWVHEVEREEVIDSHGLQGEDDEGKVGPLDLRHSSRQHLVPVGPLGIETITLAWPSPACTPSSLLSLSLRGVDRHDIWCLSTDDGLGYWARTRIMHSCSYFLTSGPCDRYQSRELSVFSCTCSTHNVYTWLNVRCVLP